MIFDVVFWSLKTPTQIRLVALNQRFYHLEKQSPFFFNVTVTVYLKNSFKCLGPLCSSLTVCFTLGQGLQSDKICVFEPLWDSQLHSVSVLRHVCVQVGHITPRAEGVCLFQPSGRLFLSHTLTGAGIQCPICVLHVGHHHCIKVCILYRLCIVEWTCPGSLLSFRN